MSLLLPTTIPTLNPLLLTAARRTVDKRASADLQRLDEAADAWIARLEKTAIVPAGDPSQGAPPQDPSAGGGAPPAPAPDPAMGGAPPAGGGDPTQQIVQQILQQLQAGGGAGGAGKPGGGKKAEQQLLDIKLWTIQYLLVELCKAQGVKVDPSIVVGPPPDPMMMQQAQQEQAAPAGGGANVQDPSAMGGGAPGGDPSMGGGAPPAGPAPVQPMDPSQGPIGKAANAFDIGGEFANAEFDAILGRGQRQFVSMAARARQVLGFAE